MELSHYFLKGHLEDGERILYVAHRHFYVFFKESVKTFFFGLALPLFFFFLFPKLILPLMAWGIIGVLGMLYHFVDWYFDTWIITNHGIIDIERNGLFDKESKRVEYEMIDGMEYKMTGFLATIFNFGDLSVDTMGTTMSLRLKDATNPKKLESIIVGFQEKYVTNKSFNNYNSLKDMLAEMIAHHVKQNGGPINNSLEDKKKR